MAVLKCKYKNDKKINGMNINILSTFKILQRGKAKECKNKYSFIKN